MRERRSWTPEEIEIFEHAREELKQLEPNIKNYIDNFNKSNTYGLIIEYPGDFGTTKSGNSWPTICGTVPAKDGVRAERVTNMRAVHIISDEEAGGLGEFIANVQEKFGLNIKRCYDRSNQEITNISYDLKPYYQWEHGKIVGAFFKPHQ